MDVEQGAQGRRHFQRPKKALRSSVVSAVLLRGGCEAGAGARRRLQPLRRRGRPLTWRAVAQVGRLGLVLLLCTWLLGCANLAGSTLSLRLHVHLFEDVVDHAEKHEAAGGAVTDSLAAARAAAVRDAMRHAWGGYYKVRALAACRPRAHRRAAAGCSAASHAEAHAPAPPRRPHSRSTLLARMS
jgi:hypothetical protein